VTEPLSGRISQDISVFKKRPLREVTQRMYLVFHAEDSTVAIFYVQEVRTVAEVNSARHALVIISKSQHYRDTLATPALQVKLA
jgi:hypothetical protein